MDLDAAMAERVKKGKVSVPPSPVVALRLVQLLADEHSGAGALVQALEQDQALAAIVLRLANSAAYLRSGQVVSLKAAVVTLGHQALRELSVAKELHERTLVTGPLVALRRRAWRESLSSARIASWVAPFFGCPAEDAFVAGLLHDIGRVPAIGVLEQLLREHPAADTRSEEGWWAMVEVHHLAFGALLARSWGLPTLIAGAIAQHHDLAVSSPLLETLRVADEVVRLLDGEPALAAHHLGEIAALSTEQGEALAEQLPLLPGTFDAFREPALREPANVIDYELKLPDALDPELQVTLTCEGLVAEADVLSVSLALFGVRRALRVGQLVKVRAGEARFHARVTASDGEASELAPWALDSRQAEEWRRFIARKPVALAS
ncbi:MAG: HDOD domain-containing protein [Archangium sp.]|nr:HDOD domain-containing protein [Archangium sp.]